MITAGDRVKFKAEHDWVAERYNFSMEKEYEVISTHHFWCSAKIINDLGKEMSFDVDRLTKMN